MRSRLSDILNACSLALLLSGSTFVAYATQVDKPPAKEKSAEIQNKLKSVKNDLKVGLEKSKTQKDEVKKAVTQNENAKPGAKKRKIRYQISRGGVIIISATDKMFLIKNKPDVWAKIDKKAKEKREVWRKDRAKLRELAKLGEQLKANKVEKEVKANKAATSDGKAVKSAGLGTYMFTADNENIASEESKQSGNIDSGHNPAIDNIVDENKMNKVMDALDVLDKASQAYDDSLLKASETEEIDLDASEEDIYKSIDEEEAGSDAYFRLYEALVNAISALRDAGLDDEADQLAEELTQLDSQADIEDQDVSDDSDATGSDANNTATTKE